LDKEIGAMCFSSRHKIFSQQSKQNTCILFEVYDNGCHQEEEVLILQQFFYLDLGASFSKLPKVILSFWEQKKQFNFQGSLSQKV